MNSLIIAKLLTLAMAFYPYAKDVNNNFFEKGRAPYTQAGALVLELSQNVALEILATIYKYNKSKDIEINRYPNMIKCIKKTIDDTYSLLAEIKGVATPEDGAIFQIFLNRLKKRIERCNLLIEELSTLNLEVQDIPEKIRDLTEKKDELIEVLQKVIDTIRIFEIKISQPLQLPFLENNK